MKKRNTPQWLFTILFLFIAIPIFPQNKLETWPAPEGAALNNDFTVKVRLPGQNWQELPTYLVKVDEVRNTKHNEEKASMAYFNFSGEVEVSVTSNKGLIQTAKVRPLSHGIIPQIEGNTMNFKLDNPRNLSVEVNGDIFHNLHLFANPLEEYVPNPKDKDVIYFGPGIHRFEMDRFVVPSGKTVYVSGGAILMGQILINEVRDVKVIGRGMVDHTVKMGIRIANSQNILVEGLFATQCSTGGSDSVTIRNVKSISYFGWGDGMNVFASNNVLHDNVFCRNSDDCTTVYGTRLGFVGGCRNITMQNSTLWADVAHPIFIGIHGNVENPEILENLNYVNIDILDHKEMQIDYQGCLAINAGDENLIRNVRFENIRIENFRQGQLVNLRIFFNEKYCKAPGRGIENVLFRNISYTGDHAEISIMAGYNSERKVKNIRFENLRINGKLISDDMPDKPTWYKTADMARFSVGEHVENVTFTLNQTFLHPGILYTENDFLRMRQFIADTSSLAYGSYQLLKDHRLSQADYTMRGPFPIISRDGKHGNTKGSMESDFHAAYQNALMWALTKDEKHAQKSFDILFAYADLLHTIPETNDAPLLAGLEGFKIISALEILKYTYLNGNTKKNDEDSQKKLQKIETMIRGVFVPVMENFYKRPPYTNGNWGPIVTYAYMAAAIYFDDHAMYEKAKDFYLHANDNGTILHYIDGETGQIQESGRDQPHAQLGIGAMAVICEMAWKQNDDLYSALENRLLKGYEYVAKYNLGYDDVPFKQWTDITGKYNNWTTISDKGRGQLRPIYEIAYNHYVFRKKMEMPFTKQVLKKIRPENYFGDQPPAFGSLLFNENGDDK